MFNRVTNSSEFELRKRLQEALASGSYFITVTRVVEEQGRLEHYYLTRDFPTQDIVPTLEHFAVQVEGQRVDDGGPIPLSPEGGWPKFDAPPDDDAPKPDGPPVDEE